MRLEKPAPGPSPWRLDTWLHTPGRMQRRGCSDQRPWRGATGQERHPSQGGKVPSYASVPVRHHRTLADSSVVERVWRQVAREFDVDEAEILKSCHGRRDIDVAQDFFQPEFRDAVPARVNTGHSVRERGGAGPRSTATLGNTGSPLTAGTPAGQAPTGPAPACRGGHRERRDDVQVLRDHAPELINLEGPLRRARPEGPGGPLRATEGEPESPSGRGRGHCPPPRPVSTTRGHGEKSVVDPDFHAPLPPRRPERLNDLPALKQG